MPCLIVLLAFFFPRVVLAVLALTTDYLGAAYQTVLWPVLGFFFLPYTTLAYAWAWHAGGGTLNGLALVVLVVALLVDLGVVGGGARARRRR